MKTNLLKVSIRQGAFYIAGDEIVASNTTISPSTMELLVNLRKTGYTVSEKLLHVLNNITPGNQLFIFNTMKELFGLNLNWAPLVKGWDTPTGESRIDHIITFFANVLKIDQGTRLQCGHIIPANTFPLERYNGCPFCGTPFELTKTTFSGQGSKMKVLEYWSEENLSGYLLDLLESRTALDATQIDSLKILVQELPLPDADIIMKETQMIVVDMLVEKGEYPKAQCCFSNPNDILRYLWYKKTGFLQLVEPKTIIKRTARNNRHMLAVLDKGSVVAAEKKKELKLKYNRSECRMVATWLNNLTLDAEKACETMHAKRGMWVRFIRALRLAEYAEKKEFGYLKELMDIFYNQTYTVFQGEVERCRLKLDADKTFELLKQRPGLFARSLFANMLWFGEKDTLKAFEQVMDKVPARLLFTLNMYAPDYFNPNHNRVVKPLGGTSVTIGANKLLGIYSAGQLKEMISAVEELCVQAVLNRFAQINTDHKTMYIDPLLYNIPLAIGDRTETVQDLSAALLGTRFPVEGNSVRLFMQWGQGLKAQHLDMDLSCHIAMYDRVEVCSYYNLQATGAKHSGDIRSIPDNVGTAEYVELDINELLYAGAKYVVFTCNAYSNGSISPNLVVGWMNSAFPMKISAKNGVAYDPSCVQHQVRVSQGLLKGLVFGVLDVNAREIIWLEMPYQGQTVANMNTPSVEALLAKLNSKTTIGNLLAIKALAQNLEINDTPDADEVYTLQWAANTAAVTKLLID